MRSESATEEVSATDSGGLLYAYETNVAPEYNWSFAISFPVFEEGAALGASTQYMMVPLGPVPGNVYQSSLAVGL